MAKYAYLENRGCIYAYIQLYIQYTCIYSGGPAYGAYLTCGALKPAVSQSTLAASSLRLLSPHLECKGDPWHSNVHTHKQVLALRFHHAKSLRF